jgi:hypothetical protein
MKLDDYEKEYFSTYQAFAKTARFIVGGFHGKSLGSLLLMGKASFREPFGGGLQDMRFTPCDTPTHLKRSLPKLRRWVPQLRPAGSTSTSNPRSRKRNFYQGQRRMLKTDK